MAQAHVPSVDSVICREMNSLVSCTVDELAQRLPAYSWTQVSTAVDRLRNTDGQPTHCFGYVVSVGPLPPTPRSSRERKYQALFGRIS